MSLEIKPNRFTVSHPLDHTPQIEAFVKPKKPSTPPCPHCLNKRNVIKAGKRKTKQRGPTQRYRCTKCNTTFSTAPLPRTNYPPKVIAFALQYYNEGHTHEQTKNTIKTRLKTTVPLPTLQAWIKRNEHLCTFTPWRRKYQINPKTIIRSKKLYHQQIFHFAYHDLKLNIAGKTFPKLKYYLWSVARSGTRREKNGFTKIFESSSNRCSVFKPPVLPPVQIKTIKENNAVRLTRLALPLAKNRRQRHEKIEHFFLANDSSTAAIEIPVFLYPKEAPDLLLKEPLTGHIDLLQVRNDLVQILDYKPDQNPQRAQTQLYLYKRALSKRTNIPLQRIQTAAFNEDGYSEFRY